VKKILLLSEKHVKQVRNEEKITENIFITHKSKSKKCMPFSRLYHFWCVLYMKIKHKNIPKVIEKSYFESN